MAQDEAQSTGAVVFFVLSKTFDLLGLLIKCVTYITIAYIALLAVRALSGKTTIADFALSYVTGEGKALAASWAVAVTCAVWALTERHLRLKKIAAMGTHNAELEKRIDPGRSSSNLTVEGETAPGDAAL